MVFVQQNPWVRVMFQHGRLYNFRKLYGNVCRYAQRHHRVAFCKQSAYHTGRFRIARPHEGVSSSGLPLLAKQGNSLPDYPVRPREFRVAVRGRRPRGLFPLPCSGAPELPGWIAYYKTQGCQSDPATAPLCGRSTFASSFPSAAGRISSTYGSVCLSGSTPKRHRGQPYARCSVRGSATTSTSLSQSGPGCSTQGCCHQARGCHTTAYHPSKPARKSSTRALQRYQSMSNGPCRNGHLRGCSGTAALGRQPPVLRCVTPPQKEGDIAL